MKENERPNADIVLPLSVGLIAGFLITASVFITLSHNAMQSDSPAQPAGLDSAASVSRPELLSAAPVSQPPVQSQTSDWTATAITQPPAQMPVMSNELPQQGSDVIMRTDPSSVSEDGMTAGVSVHSSGSGGEYVSVNPIYSANPSWTVSRNGLVGNPAVDPPSSRGRAYRLEGSY